MEQGLKAKTIVLLGGCFGGFSLVALATFTTVFLKMGLEPLWHAQAAQPSKLSAPVLVPRTGVGAQMDSIELHWQAVAGAVRYHLHVWQIHDGDETTLLDNDVEATDAKVQLVHPAPIQWEIQAIDPQGKPGVMNRSGGLVSPD